uniref:Uncharacterized protein n=2 Tax=Aegilops tauschii subsp. strangulata TaxID=200361 RepID=A0A453AV69_AEGTS
MPVDMWMLYHGIDTFHSTDTAYQREALDALFLLDMDMKVKAIIKLINEDVDSFGRRAEMYQNIFSFGGKGAVKSQEVQRLTVEINMANEKWDALMQSKMHQESAIRELKMEIGSLTEQNHSSELLIQQLRGEINSLRDSKGEL